VLLIDPDGRVLLIEERVTGATHWLTPGGGREPGESAVQAAARETYEETSLLLELDPGAPVVHTRQRRWQWDGVTYEQTDDYFLVVLDHRPEVAAAALTELEQATLLGFRWWSVDELRATSDEIEPPDLADLLDRLRRTGGLSA
jgi:8-oxo-dGTP pyrophosphatase MutT (NUDIX family)